MIKFNRAHLLLLASFVFVGCTSIQDAANKQGSGEKRAYQRPLPQVHEAIVYATKKTRGTIKSQSSDKTLITYPVSAFSWGENVAIFTTPNVNGVDVEIVSLRVNPMNITATDWTKPLYKYIDERLH